MMEMVYIFFPSFFPLLSWVPLPACSLGLGALPLAMRLATSSWPRAEMAPLRRNSSSVLIAADRSSISPSLFLSPEFFQISKKRERE